VPCGGLNKALRILNAITEGNGTPEHLGLLDELVRMIRETSLCGLGQTAPNPVLTPFATSARNTKTILWPGVAEPAFARTGAVSCENSCPLRMNIPRFLELIRRAGSTMLSSR